MKAAEDFMENGAWNGLLQLESVDEALSCSLNASSCSDASSGVAVCSCQLYHEYGITMENYSMSLTTRSMGMETSNVACPDFDTSQNIKLIAPFNLSISHEAPCETYNFTWQIAYDETDYVKEFEYELRYKRMQDDWELQKIKHEGSNQRVLRLVFSELEQDTEHVAQIRTRPAMTSDYKAVWSDWSPPVKWRTDMCQTEPDQLSFIMIVCGVISTFFIIAVVVLANKHDKLWKKLWVIIPNPAPFFEPLFVEHEGNFTKWVNARYPDVLYEVTEKNAVVLEKGDAVQVYDGPNALDKRWMMGLKPWDKQSDIHSSWQALCDPSSAHSMGKFANNLQQWKDKSYGQASIDTVTVTDESSCSHCKYKDKPSRPPYMTQCNSNPARENSNMQDYPPTKQFFTHLDPTGSPQLSDNTTLLNNIMSLLQTSGDLEGADGNVLDLQCLNISDWDPDNETFSINDEDASWADRNVSEGVSWSDGSLDAISSSSRLEADLGYPKVSLDLDTVDSGFTETDAYFMPTVDLGCTNGAGYEKELDDNSLTNSEKQNLYYRSYVKQWVKSPSTSVDCNAQEHLQSSNLWQARRNIRNVSSTSTSPAQVH
ncbi:interleukin-21 receptor-like isoform X2 [Narcine bancroftii]|uniref:interleukin-21 receptor-like isoform X2 n=1 Tax=Narcine bancroftii TaxID=1343680 RepID=UPI003831EDCF